MDSGLVMVKGGSVMVVVRDVTTWFVTDTKLGGTNFVGDEVHEVQSSGLWVERSSALAKLGKDEVLKGQSSQGSLTISGCCLSDRRDLAMAKQPLPEAMAMKIGVRQLVSLFIEGKISNC
ncbi:hypothetical protein TREMEDRAFT_62160 [Tremella mesenterica DSM 1558]|uniref:uncharacterized protein n=1 Tax=Tremella mesenterica (strain ATCC 24925 / CBS 8224 / DSM 1558 / NBRC 9311 / NRRL Y-6157 / RJB 2259-6 / UBC 559-6) TaxID=578456 RepID=UPI0003F49918|nr:uncharacterized protein TREMEDRAFT_62160 [Tremella mesenterica DSM 1558]EIW69297.1 hypothetical protein TREMEDRAFT_62160 [Tremella mesenterica DSM 1558]